MFGTPNLSQRKVAKDCFQGGISAKTGTSDTFTPTPFVFAFCLALVLAFVLALVFALVLGDAFGWTFTFRGIRINSEGRIAPSSCADRMLLRICTITKQNVACVQLSCYFWTLFGRIYQPIVIPLWMRLDSESKKGFVDLKRLKFELNPRFQTTASVTIVTGKFGFAFLLRM